MLGEASHFNANQVVLATLKSHLSGGDRVSGLRVRQMEPDNDTIREVKLSRYSSAALSLSVSAIVSI